MAPLPANSTARLFVDYTVCGEEHTALVRYKAPNTYDDALAAFAAVVAEASPLVFASTVNNVRFANILSDFTNPVPGTWPTGWGEGAGTHIQTANMLSFRSRSLDGRKGGFILFGCKFTESGGDARINSAESADVEAVLAELASSEGSFLTINGFQPSWYQYANIGQDAYWRNKIR